MNDLNASTGKQPWVSSSAKVLAIFCFVHGPDTQRICPSPSECVQGSVECSPQQIVQVVQSLLRCAVVSIILLMPLFHCDYS